MVRCPGCGCDFDPSGHAAPRIWPSDGTYTRKVLDVVESSDGIGIRGVVRIVRLDYSTVRALLVMLCRRGRIRRIARGRYARVE
jgi:hypothetical protein